MAEPLFTTIRPRTRWVGRHVAHYAKLGSTMDEARRLSDEGAAPGTFVVADQQTRGRGRLDRAWHSLPGSLLATLVARPGVPVEAGGLIPIAAGVALAEAIRKVVRAPALVKWPNDVWIRERKVAGVLVETRLAAHGFERVLIGIGVNGNIRGPDFPEALRGTATSLSEEAKRHICLPAVLKVFAERLEPLFDDLEGARGDIVLARARDLSSILERRVVVESSEGSFEGIARAFGKNGELVVETKDGPRVVSAGDCRLLRPAAPTSPGS